MGDTLLLLLYYSGRNWFSCYYNGHPLQEILPGEKSIIVRFIVCSVYHCSQWYEISFFSKVPYQRMFDYMAGNFKQVS